MDDTGAVVRVLAVTPLEEDFVQLQHIFSHSRWEIRRVRTRREASEFLVENEMAVVIAERNLPDGDWTGVVAEAARSPARPVVIVACHLADDKLWMDVLDQGGYDVIAKPFVGAELVRTVSLAWRHWKHERRRFKTPGGEQTRAAGD